MTVRFRQSTATAALGSVSLAVLLGGCSASTAADPAETGSSGGSASATATASGTYADGDYSATGDYQTPGGAESIEVDLSIADGVITEVTVAGDATGGNAERYQSRFADGISTEVVGKNIDDLAVDKVAGSSLTSDGFNAAVEQIKADASA